jgi:hypothetical protein
MTDAKPFPSIDPCPAPSRLPLDEYVRRLKDLYDARGRLIRIWGVEAAAEFERDPKNRRRLREYLGGWDLVPNPPMAYDHMPDGLQLKLLCDGWNHLFLDLFTFEEVAVIVAAFEGPLRRIGAPTNDPQAVQIREKWVQAMIMAAVQKAYPDGVIPDSERPAGLQRKVTEHFKSVKRNPPSWDTCDAYLKHYRGEGA